MEEVDKEISETRLSLNARTRIVAESYLATASDLFELGRTCTDIEGTVYMKKSALYVIVRALTEPSRLPSSDEMLSTERRLRDRIHYLQITRGKSYQSQVMETKTQTQQYERDTPLALTARRARQEVRIYV